MINIKERAASSTKDTAPKNIKLALAYQKLLPQSRKKTIERIAEHRKNIPRQFRRAYDVAIGGRSLRAAVNSQCIECLGYVFKEVRLCCSPQCPLFPYRPLRGVSYGVSGLGQSDAESTKTSKGDDYAG